MPNKGTILTKSTNLTILTKTCSKLALGMFALWALFACECPGGNGPTDPEVDQEAPSISNHTFSIIENVPFGSEVGRVIATDNVAVTAYNIISGNVGDAFSIDNNGLLTTAGAIDYDDVSNYRLTVQALDAAE